MYLLGLIQGNYLKNPIDLRIIAAQLKVTNEMDEATRLSV
jgi:hypothetical protein